jgi:hypothetical protein
MEVSGYIHNSAALSPGKEPQIPIGQESRWASELVWMWWWIPPPPPTAGRKRNHGHKARSQSELNELSRIWSLFLFSHGLRHNHNVEQSKRSKMCWEIWVLTMHWSNSLNPGRYINWFHLSAPWRQAAINVAFFVKLSKLTVFPGLAVYLRKTWVSCMVTFRARSNVVSFANLCWQFSRLGCLLGDITRELGHLHDHGTRHSAIKRV